ncbi:MAG: hypothetical protein LUD81_01620 [Clostridiales bacterium]|nr:hypothetical protein [Clostridiales bacterium]
MKTIDIGFLGYGTRALDALFQDDRFNVKYFITPKSRLCDDVWDCEKKYRDRVKMEIVSNKTELRDRFSEIKDVECFIMNACPYILTEEILSLMTVYNIHPGNLHNNRGHHPHLWSVLLDERETEICIHKVSSQIDLGEVVESIKIPLSGKENSLEVLNKAEDEIPQLLDSLYEYLTGKRPLKYSVKTGVYRAPLTYDDYEIKETDGLRDIDRKIRARYMHNGAFICFRGKRVYVDKIISAEKSDEKYFEIKDGRAVYANNGFALIFNIKKITDFNGNSIILSRR